MEDTISSVEPFAKQDLLDIVHYEMPFGKYKGTTLIDLPEPYLLWFAKKEFPKGRLGQLMALTLALKIEGLESIVRPLKKQQP